MTKSKKKNRISLTKVRQALKSCVFDPKIPGTMCIIADVDNIEYFLGRAKEEIEIFKANNQEGHIEMAIQLLVLALHKENEQV